MRERATLNRLITACVAFASLAIAMFPGAAHGYIVGPPMSLEALTNNADVIFKGTAVSSSKAPEKSSFPAIMGFATYETDFKIVSILKGQTNLSTLRFLHYARDSGVGLSPYEPQHYHFEAGRTYLVFAKQSVNAKIFQQITMYRSTKEDQGVLLCANDNPVTAPAVKDIFWSELLALLESRNADDVVYALDQLDQMSATGDQARLSGVSEFDRKSVLRAVRPFMTNSDTRIAREAIGVIGSDNPYMAEWHAASWLETVKSAKQAYFAPMERVENIGGELYWRDLVSIANSNADSAIRSYAISALGRTLQPSLRPYLLRWLSDPDATVRGSATVLLSDFPALATRDRVARLARDPSAVVRSATAREIGFAQQVSAAGIAAKLLTDPDSGVRKMAAMSLLSFSPDNTELVNIFKSNVDNKEFQPLFLIALASNDAAPYLDVLARTVEEKPTPAIDWGSNTDIAAWEILFKYLQSVPFAEIRSGKFDRYLDAMEKIGNYSSSYQCEIYAFYLQRAMNDRAGAYRSKADKAVTYDLDQYFDQVDRQYKHVRATQTPRDQP